MKFLQEKLEKHKNFLSELKLEILKEIANLQKKLAGIENPKELFVLLLSLGILKGHDKAELELKQRKEKVLLDLKKKRSLCAKGENYENLNDSLLTEESKKKRTTF